MHPQDFNPLTGIRSFLTFQENIMHLTHMRICFNPLTGIRSFLTKSNGKYNPGECQNKVSIPSRGFVLF